MYNKLLVKNGSSSNKFNEAVQRWVGSKKTIEELEAAKDLLFAIDIESEDDYNEIEKYQYHTKYANSTKDRQLFEKLALVWSNLDVRQALGSVNDFLQELKTHFLYKWEITRELSPSKLTSDEASDRESISNIYETLQLAKKLIEAKCDAVATNHRSEAEKINTKKIELLKEISRIKEKIQLTVETLDKEIPEVWVTRALKTHKRDELKKLSESLNVTEESTLDEIKRTIIKYQTKLNECKEDRRLIQGRFFSQRSRTLINELSKNLKDPNNPINRNYR